MKRMIKANSDYTSNVSSEVSVAVKKFLDTPPEDLTYRIVKSAYNAYVEDRESIPTGWDALDIKYAKDKGRFYQKYKPFVDKCNSNIDIGHVSGYRGAKDYEKLQIADLFEIVDSTFPYGWKQFVNFID